MSVESTQLTRGENGKLSVEALLIADLQEDQILVVQVLLQPPRIDEQRLARRSREQRQGEHGREGEEEGVFTHTLEARLRSAAGQWPCSELDRRCSEPDVPGHDTRSAYSAIFFRLCCSNACSTVGSRSRGTGLPSTELVEAIVRVESDFDPLTVSHKGALGLMQVMPKTGERFGVSRDDLFDPARNLDAGAAYISWLLTRYRDLDLALAAYNAGEGAVDQYRGIPPYRETQQYVKKVRRALLRDRA